MFQTKRHHFGSILILEVFRSSASVCYDRSPNNDGNLQSFDRTPSLNGRSQHKSCVISVCMSTTRHTSRLGLMVSSMDASFAPTSDANPMLQATITPQLPSASARCLIETKSFVPTSDANPRFQPTTTLQLPSVSALWLTKTNALGRVVARVVVGY